MHKAAKGEFRQGLPVGYDYDADDRVVLCADEALVEAIATVFRRFDELGSARQVLLGLIADGLLLPRRTSTRARVRWASPTYPAVHDFLTAMMPSRWRTAQEMLDATCTARPCWADREEDRRGRMHRAVPTRCGRARRVLA